MALNSGIHVLSGLGITTILLYPAVGVHNDRKDTGIRVAFITALSIHPSDDRTLSKWTQYHLRSRGYELKFSKAGQF